MEKDLPISWNNFTWWISDQKYQTQSGRYFRGYWVDTQRFDVTPSSAWRLYTTLEDWINAIFSLEKINGNTDVISWLNNGKIYFNSTLASTIAWTAKQWYRIGYMKPNWSSVYKLYYFHYTNPLSFPVKQIHRTNIDWTWLDENYRNYTSSDGNPFLWPPSWMIVLSEWNRIVFSYYNEIFELSKWEVVTKLISFPSEENIVGITKFLWEYKVYTTSAYATSKIYKWDWKNSLPTISVDLNGLAITGWVYSLGAFDYVVADRSLFRVSWVQYQKLYDNIIGRILIWFDEKIFLEQNDGINTYISEFSSKPWYNEWIHPKFFIDTAEPTVWVWAIDYDSQWLVYTQSRKIFKSNWTIQTWSVTPYLESMVYVWSNIQYEESISDFIFKFSWFTTQNIVLKAQIQENWTWITLFTGNNNSISTQNHGLKIPANILANAVWKFNTIRFRVEFPHNWTAEWRFYWLDIILKENIWK
jgi:hypothetical protein